MLTGHDPMQLARHGAVHAMCTPVSRKCSRGRVWLATRAATPGVRIVVGDGRRRRPRVRLPHTARPPMPQPRQPPMPQQPQQPMQQPQEAPGDAVGSTSIPKVHRAQAALDAAEGSGTDSGGADGIPDAGVPEDVRIHTVADGAADVDSQPSARGEADIRKLYPWLFTKRAAEVSGLSVRKRYTELVRPSCSKRGEGKKGKAGDRPAHHRILLHASTDCIRLGGCEVEWSRGLAGCGECVHV
eukprot:359599-Chlamydomonas_euryale.AAC.3